MPAFTISSFASPTHFSAADTAGCTGHPTESRCDEYLVTITNVGKRQSDGSAVTIADTLPPGLLVKAVQMGEGGGSWVCSSAPLQCTLPAGTVEPDQRLEMEVEVTVEPGTSGPLTNKVSVSGGGAAPAGAEELSEVSSAVPPFGFSAFSAPVGGIDGLPASQAGAHPYESSFTFALDNDLRLLPDVSGGTGKTSVEDVRDIAVDLPVGFVGAATAAPQCTLAQLSSRQRCPADTEVGHIETQPNSLAAVQSRIWNIVPEHGVAAEFGYIDALDASHVLYARVVPTPAGYTIETTSPEIPQISLDHIFVTFFGDPAARNGAAAKEGAEEVPFFTNPANCDAKALVTSAHMDSWLHPGATNPDGSVNLADPNWASSTSESEAVSGCNKLAGLFKPTIEATPETNRGDSPTGLEVVLKVPQAKGVETLATPPLKKAVVTLPEGMTVNPSAANGLSGCSLAALGISATGQPGAAPPNCPDASKVGTVELLTPALAGDPTLGGALQGQIYLARQTENPFNSLLALYLVIDDPFTGVTVKLPGEIKADPTTGQLSAVFDNNPQLPFSELRTKFFGGQKAALRTPAVCGSYKVTSQLTPWSAPQSGPPATPSSSFKITQGCAPSAAEEPNAPHFAVGTEAPLAGAFSPLGLELSREDGSQELSGLNLTLPPGLTGKLAGLTECSDAQLATATARSGLGQGALEQSSPSCPASSEVGTVTVGAGAGLTPYYAQGHAYLAGPYKGAPLSLAVIAPAVAGPFDLGDVLVRNALYVDPETAQITAKSDPIPHILDGIPLDVRSIALNMSRHEFTLNPTNCEKKAVSGAALSVFGQGAALTTPFQVGGCKALGFKPGLTISLKGGTKRNQNPALTATVTYPKQGSYANIASAQVTLPHSEFLDQSHIKTVCTRVQFAAKACPAASIYGHASATTPLLAQPLSGPVYLRSSSNKLPDLVADLNGQIEVSLDGKVDTGKGGGLRNSFEMVPDAPVSKFVLSMQGGKKGLLVNSENICAKPQHALADFTAQNGKVDDTTPLIGNSCGAKGKKKHGKKHKRATG